MHTQDEMVQPDQASIALSDHRGPRVGRHMPTNSNAVKAAQLAKQLGCEAIQIFASNPTGWQPSADEPARCAAFAKAARACDLDPVVFHGPTLLNPASPEDIICETATSLLSWT